MAIKIAMTLVASLLGFALEKTPADADAPKKRPGVRRETVQSP